MKLKGHPNYFNHRVLIFKLYKQLTSSLTSLSSLSRGQKFLRHGVSLTFRSVRDNQETIVKTALGCLRVLHKDIYLFSSKWISCSLHLHVPFASEGSMTAIFSAMKSLRLLTPLDGHYFKYSQSFL